MTTNYSVTYTNAVTDVIPVGVGMVGKGFTGEVALGQKQGGGRGNGTGLSREAGKCDVMRRDPPFLPLPVFFAQGSAS